LNWAVVVGNTGDDAWNAIGTHIGANQEIRGRFGGGIGTSGLQGRILIGKGAGRHIVLDFILGNMEEAGNLHFARYLKKDERSGDIGFNDLSRCVDAAIQVGFGREMEYGVATSHGRFDCVGIADIPFDEAIVRNLGNRGEVARFSA
jgi:hypothetical protein